MGPDIISGSRLWMPWRSGWDGFEGWILAGHTHGGQIRIPFVGPLRLPVVNRQWDQGLFELGRTRFYVSRGVGYLRKMRFFCRPEVPVFRLTSKA